MTYNPDIPIGDLSPSVQVTQIQTNFSEFNNVFNVQHGSINTASQGKHEAIVFKKQATDSDVSLDLDVLYSKDITSTSGAGPQIFLRIPKFIPKVENDPMQLTFDVVNTAGPQYQTFLPGGYIFCFENITGVAPSAANLVFNITIVPTPTSIVCPIANTNSMTVAGTPVPCAIKISNVLASTFDITMQSPGAGQPYSLTWMAVAKQ